MIRMDKNDKIFAVVCIVCSITFLLTFPGCKSTEYVTVPVHTTDTLYVNNVERDSIQVKDSVYVYRTPDSVFVYREKIAYKDRLVTDTVIHKVYEEKPVEVTKTVEVKKPYTIWEKVLMWCGVAFIVTVVGIIMYHVKK